MARRLPPELRSSLVDQPFAQEIIEGSGGRQRIAGFTHAGKDHFLKENEVVVKEKNGGTGEETVSIRKDGESITLKEWIENK